ncbi:MAG TPA: hypothetical protein VKW04_18560 [Planctomycetota bacterium]|nr:hypothetical protein [Planctomycetota bacterium]
MDTTRQNKRWAWGMLLLALGAADAGSVWSLGAGGDCSSCHAAGSLFPENVLAGAGVAAYSGLLAAAAVLGPTLLVSSGILIAAGVHVGLVVWLLHLRILCPPCLLVAAAAAVAAGSLLACDRSNTLRASLLIPGAALLLETWAVLRGELPPDAGGSRGDLVRVAGEAFSQPAVPPGTVRMLAYTRSDCGYCVELEREVLPALVRDYGSRLQIERRPADDLPGIPTPTLILTGGEKRRLFPGLPSSSDLRTAIDSLLGDDHGVQTLLKNPR